jgi:hypothetical protein
MSKLLSNILIIFIVASMLFLDGLAIHDIIAGEPDIANEIGMIFASFLVFIAIGYYIKLRRKKALNR